MQRSRPHEGGFVSLEVQVVYVFFSEKREREGGREIETQKFYRDQPDGKYYCAAVSPAATQQLCPVPVRVIAITDTDTDTKGKGKEKKKTFQRIRIQYHDQSRDKKIEKKNLPHANSHLSSFPIRFTMPQA
jgi:hypothetical protein